MPPFLVEIMHPVFFAPRYFLVILPFVYIPLAMLMGRLLNARGGGIAVAVLLSLFATRHMNLYWNFLHFGRGQYSAGLQFMADHTNSPVLRVASNQDFRANMELNYFAPHVLGSRQLMYVPREMQISVPAEWYIVHGDGDRPGPPTLRLPNQPPWYRAAYFGTSDLSGQSWTIYNYRPAP